MAGKRVLFVDDDPIQRLTLPAILQLHGFEVSVASTVAQALAEMTTRGFDVLISDLNIGEPGDGFTVVSAMHRTQPECINFIVTGFPAFESALASIQRQVDDVLVKPAEIDKLIETIEQRMRERHPQHHPMTPLRLSQLLRSSVEEILQGVLEGMKSDPALSVVALSDDARAGCLRELLAEVACQMDSATPDEPTASAMALSREHGARLLAAGYSIAMLVSEKRIVGDVIYDMVRERLLVLDTSSLMLDLKRLNDSLYKQLEESAQTFWMEAAKAKPRSMEVGLA